MRIRDCVTRPCAYVTVASMCNQYILINLWVISLVMPTVGGRELSYPGGFPFLGRICILWGWGTVWLYASFQYAALIGRKTKIILLLCTSFFRQLNVLRPGSVLYFRTEILLGKYTPALPRNNPTPGVYFVPAFFAFFSIMILLRKWGMMDH